MCLNRKTIFGVLTCVVLCISGLMAQTPGTIIQGPENTAAVIGTPGFLNCTITLRDDIMRWEKDSEIGSIYDTDSENAAQGYTVQRISDGDNEIIALRVDSVQQSSGDRYTCTLAYANDQEPAELVALSPVECLPDEPDYQTVDEGDIALLHCNVWYYGHSSSVLKPTMDFQYEDATLPSTELGEAENYVNLTATETNIDKDKDNKVATCTLTMTGGSNPPSFTDTCTTLTYVRHDVGNIQFEPDYTGSALNVEVGDLINCTADGRPEPEFMWRSDNWVYTYSGDKLEIQPHMAGGTNHYHCVANNTFQGEEKSASREITFYATNTDVGSASNLQLHHVTWMTGFLLLVLSRY